MSACIWIFSSFSWSSKLDRYPKAFRNFYMAISLARYAILDREITYGLHVITSTEIIVLCFAHGHGIHKATTFITLIHFPLLHGTILQSSHTNLTLSIFIALNYIIDFLLVSLRNSFDSRLGLVSFPKMRISTVGKETLRGNFRLFFFCDG